MNTNEAAMLTANKTVVARRMHVATKSLNDFLHEGNSSFKKARQACSPSNMYTGAMFSSASAAETDKRYPKVRSR